MTELSCEEYEAMADAQSDKDDLTAIFLWKRLLSLEGLPDAARSYAEEVIGLYRNRLAVGDGRSGGTCEDVDDSTLSSYRVNMLLRMFIGRLEDIEELGVSNKAKEKIAQSIALYEKSIAG